jgi:hypothetical protein
VTTEWTAAADTLEQAEASGATAEEAIADLEQQAPFVGQRVRALVTSPVTWQAVNAISHVVRTIVSLAKLDE